MLTDYVNMDHMKNAIVPHNHTNISRKYVMK